MVFLPSTAQGLRDLWLKMSQLPWINGWLSPFGAPRQNLEAWRHWSRVNQQDGQFSRCRRNRLLRWRFETGWGGDVDAIGPSQTQRLITTLQQALTLLNQHRGTA